MCNFHEKDHFKLDYIKLPSIKSNATEQTRILKLYKGQITLRISYTQSSLQWTVFSIIITCETIQHRSLCTPRGLCAFSVLYQVAQSQGAGTYWDTLSIRRMAGISNIQYNTTIRVQLRTVNVASFSACTCQQYTQCNS